MVVSFLEVFFTERQEAGGIVMSLPLMKWVNPGAVTLFVGVLLTLQ